MTSFHEDRRAREDNRNEHHLRHPHVTVLPQAHGLTLLDVQLEQARTLRDLNDKAVRMGGVALPLLDPRILAGRLESAGERARHAVVVGAESAHLYADEVAALAAALRLSLARVEALSPTSGGDTAA